MRKSSKQAALVCREGGLSVSSPLVGNHTGFCSNERRHPPGGWLREGEETRYGRVHFFLLTFFFLFFPLSPFFLLLLPGQIKGAIRDLPLISITPVLCSSLFSFFFKLLPGLFVFLHHVFWTACLVTCTLL